MKASGLLKLIGQLAAGRACIDIFGFVGNSKIVLKEVKSRQEMHLTVDVIG